MDPDWEFWCRRCAPDLNDCPHGDVLGSGGVILPVILLVPTAGATVAARLSGSWPWWACLGTFLASIVGVLMFLVAWNVVSDWADRRAFARYCEERDASRATVPASPTSSAAGERITFRRLGPEDAAEVRALSRGVWWMEKRSPATVEALLTSPATQVYGLFDKDRLVATAALLTDGLTKAVLVDVAVTEARRGEGFGDEVVTRTMATVPAGVEGILYCRTPLVDMYEGHGFAVDPSYALMLRR